MWDCYWLEVLQWLFLLTHIVNLCKLGHSYWKAVNIWEDMFYFLRFITNVPINVIQIFIFQ